MCVIVLLRIMSSIRHSTLSSGEISLNCYFDLRFHSYFVTTLIYCCNSIQDLTASAGEIVILRTWRF